MTDNKIKNKTDKKLETARLNMKIAVALSDLTATEISVRAGLSVNVLGKYMRGETMISFGNMQAVCDVLDVPLAMITSEKQITPARVRLAKILMNLNDEDLEKFLNMEKNKK